MPIELGYGYLPDGCGILANLTDFPGATVDMFDFWFAWHPIESMRYKIWNRDQHYYCQTLNPEIALNKSLSLRQRLWNTTHDIEEDCNMGKQHIRITFCNPADIGFSKEKLAKFDGTIVCSSTGNMVHFFRPTATGCELRTRFFMGYKWQNGQGFAGRREIPAARRREGAFAPQHQGVHQSGRHSPGGLRGIPRRLRKLNARRSETMHKEAAAK